VRPSAGRLQHGRHTLNDKDKYNRLVTPSHELATHSGSRSGSTPPEPSPRRVEGWRHDLSARSTFGGFRLASWTLPPSCPRCPRPVRDGVPPRRSARSRTLVRARRGPDPSLRRTHTGRPTGPPPHVASSSPLRAYVRTGGRQHLSAYLRLARPTPHGGRTSPRPTTYCDGPLDGGTRSGGHRLVPARVCDRTYTSGGRRRPVPSPSGLRTQACGHARHGAASLGGPIVLLRTAGTAHCRQRYIR
jgi:hypothetical protein